MTGSRRIGKFAHGITQIVDEYTMLAQNDERVGNRLVVYQEYRHGIYALIQAMEKYVRASIFRLVNPNNAYFRDRTRTHDVDELLSFLIEIVSADITVRHQIQQQLDDYVLQGIRFGKLHNDLRYPKYSDYHDNFSILHVNAQDAQEVANRLQLLKKFLHDLQYLSY